MTGSDFCVIDNCLMIRMPEEIDLYAAAYRKVAENYAQLLDSDKDEAQGGRWHGKENE